MNASQESPDLDFLRSFAVLSVVGFHVLELFEQRHSPHVARLRLFHSIGQWGVLIFFVHTSLVLMFSLERQQLRYPAKPSYIPFLARRIFRIFPLSVAVVSVVALLRAPLSNLIGGQFIDAHLRWGGITSNLLLLQNLTHTDSIIAPLWSLPYEMQMYLFLPLLFALARSTRYAWSLALLWGVAVFFGSHDGWLERHGVPDFVMYVPCFLAGVIAYSLTKIRNPWLPSLLWPPTLTAITLFYLLSPSYQRAWFACLMLGLAIPQFREITNPISRKSCHVIARYSYGIYLTHFLCIWLAFQVAANQPEWVRWIVLFATVIGFPIPLYHYVEEPMIMLGESVASALRYRLDLAKFSPVFAKAELASERAVRHNRQTE
jgi:peptidoglycan/LPS O-acetylase OafA/YrhL